MDKKMKKELSRLENRTIARFCEHLETTRQDTPRLIADSKRMIGWIFQDVRDIFGGEQ